jgi:GT2 family glycosyltransferase
MTNKTKISVIIPVYKNYQEFFNNLYNNKKFLDDCQVIVVNDYPQEKIMNRVKEIFPSALVIENKKNFGFGEAVNLGVKKAKHRFVFLLNSDVILKDDSFKKAILHFKTNPNLFAVSFSQEEKNNQTTGKNTIYWDKGILFHRKAADLRFGFNGWAEGGAAIFDREKFNHLGGFDLLFSPFYWEDIDLSYRAWKTGYQIIFDPDIKVVHNHGTTINQYFSSFRIKTIAYRNQFIFIFKNIDKGLLKETFLYLTYWKIKALISFDFPFLIGLLWSVFRLPIILAKRKMLKFKMSDKEIFKMFKHE